MHSRIIMKGAVRGDIIIHIQKPLLWRGVRFASKVRRWSKGDELAELGYISGICQQVREHPM